MASFKLLTNIFNYICIAYNLKVYLLCFGGSVRWFRPAQPLVTYLTQGPALRGKPVAYYLTCGGMPTQAFRRLGRLMQEQGGVVVASCVLKPASLVDGLLGRELGHIERFDLAPVQPFSRRVHDYLAERVDPPETHS